MTKELNIKEVNQIDNVLDRAMIDFVPVTDNLVNTDTYNSDPKGWTKDLRYDDIKRLDKMKKHPYALFFDGYLLPSNKSFINDSHKVQLKKSNEQVRPLTEQNVVKEIMGVNNFCKAKYVIDDYKVVLNSNNVRIDKFSKGVIDNGFKRVKQLKPDDWTFSTYAPFVKLNRNNRHKEFELLGTNKQVPSVKILKQQAKKINKIYYKVKQVCKKQIDEQVAKNK